MAEGQGGGMMTRKRRGLQLGIILMLLSLLVLFFVRESRDHVDIYFDDTQRVESYAFDTHEQPLKIAMISVLDQQDTEQYQKRLANGIGRQLHRPVLLLRRKSYMEINRLISKGEADIAMMSTGAYCMYGQQEGLSLLAMQERNGLPYYFSYIIVPQDSAASSLDELKGKSFAYVDPLSYSGYLSVQERLAQSGEDPAQFFKTSYFTYSHSDSIDAVANREVDGAAVDSLACDYLQRYNPQMLQKIRVIEVLPKRGTSPVVARKDFSANDEVQQALLHLHEDPDAADAMHHLLIDRFILPDPSLYPPIQLREGR